MLVNCPKCGFSQPQDRYCASCGVDMINFKPVEPPFWKKILGNPFVHVGLIFILVFISILFIRKQQAEDLRARVEYLKGGPVIVEHQQPPHQEASPPAAHLPPENPPVPGQQGSTSSVPSAPAGANPTVAPASTNNESASGATSKTVKTPDTNIKSNSLKVTVTYAEVDRITLDTWLDEMRSAGQLRQFGSVSQGVLSQATTKIKNARNLKTLQKINRTIELSNPTLEWFVGTHHGSDPENEIGLFSSMIMGDSKDGLIRGELEIQRAFRDSKDTTKPMERVSFGGPFELPPGAVYLMSGLIPRNFAIELEDDMAPDAFLSIFKSRAFRDRETEFTLLLEFDTSGR